MLNMGMYFGLALSLRVSRHLILGINMEAKQKERNKVGATVCKGRAGLVYSISLPHDGNHW
jgi:hypothetical protein